MAYLPSTSPNRESLLNKTTLALSASAVYTGTWENVINHSSVILYGLSDTESTVYLEFSPDGVNRDSRISFSLTSGSNEVHRITVTRPYVRLVVQNSGVNQSVLRTGLIYGEHSHLTLGLNSPTIQSDWDSLVVRAIHVGVDDAGNYRNSPVDDEGHMYVHIGDPLSAFGGLQVDEMTPVFQVSLPNTINPELVVTSSNSTTTIHASQSMFVLDTGVVAGSSGSLASRARVKTRPGQGVVTRFTALFTTGSATGTIQRVGIGDAVDGFFFTMSGSIFGIENIRDGESTFIPQSEWNTDRMDGSGGLINPSNQLLKPNYGNVYAIQYQWLGFGAQKFYIENGATGHLTPVHRVQYANANTIPSIFNPTLPITYTVDNGNNATRIILKGASFSVFNEGKIIVNGPRRSYSRDISSANGDVLVFSIRNRATFGSIANRNRILLTIASVIADGNASVRFRFIKNPTITSPSYVNVNTVSSIAEYNNSGSYVDGTGQELFAVGLAKTDSQLINLREFEFELLPSETLGIILTSTGINAGTQAILSWQEDI